MEAHVTIFTSVNYIGAKSIYQRMLAFELFCDSIYTFTKTTLEFASTYRLAQSAILDQLCNCPQKCGEKIPMEIRTRLFADYYKLGDHLKQNYYLQSYIEMRSVHKRLYQEETRVGGRLQRRVSCKYRIPIEIPPSHPSENLSAEDLKRRKPKLPPGKTVEVCQKAFMNMYSITEKRIRLQRERLITKSRYEAEEKRIEAEEMKTSVSVAKDLVASFRPLLMSQSDNAPITSLPSQLLSSIDHDITVVNNFFRNQLWKPEYMVAGKSHVPPGQLSLELGLDYE